MIKTYKQLDAIPQQCDRAFANAERRSVFLSRPWFENFVQHVGSEMPLSILASTPAPGSDEEMALLPLWSSYSRSPAVVGPRKLLALGNYYTSLYAPIYDSASPRASASISALIRAIVVDRPAWDIVDLKPLDRDSDAFNIIDETFREAGWLVHRYFAFGNWFFPSSGVSFAEYLSMRSPQLRNTLRRKEKKFNQQAKARFYIITGKDGLADALTAYQAIYQRSWKQSEPYPDFVSGLARTCASKGWLRLGIARIGDRPVAAQIWIVSHGIASIYKLAYDPEFEQFSPGSLLTAKLMEYVLDQDHVSEIDYLTGDDAYKKDWMSDRRERWGLIAFNARTVRGLLAAAYQVGAPKIGRLLLRR